MVFVLATNFLLLDDIDTAVIPTLSIGMLVILLIAPLNDIDSIEDATNKAEVLSVVLLMV